VIYEVLFAAASATLSEFGANPRWLGGKLAFSLVLHTWKQDLGRHVPVHALVAGGALTSEGEWKSPKRGFLFPVQALSRVFRGKFLAALSEARGSGRPLVAELADEKVWLALRQQLLAHDWVVYAKQPLGGPEQVLEYLGRYTHRVAISNERLVGMDETTVRFRVRATPGKRVLQRAGGGVHRPLPAPRAPERFQADSALRPAGPGGEGDEAGAGTAGLVGTPTRSGDHGDGGGLPAARRPRASGRAVPTATRDGSCRRRRFRPCVRRRRRAHRFADPHENGQCLARGFPVCSMAVSAARRCLVGSVPKSRFWRCALFARAPCSFLSRPREQQEAARLPLAKPSDPCPWLDPGAGRLQSP
jgi:hypothetical protein